MYGRTHKQHIEKMFEIIEYIIQRSEGDVPIENSEFEKMFNVFITKRISNIESEMLFELIGSSGKNSKGYTADDHLIKSHKVRKFIFSTCMCKKGYVTAHDYSPKSIRTFKDLFLQVNEKEGKLTLDREDAIIKEIKNLDLEGYQTLWEIAGDAPNPVVQERAGYFLAIIHYLYMDRKEGKYWEKETNLVVKDLIEFLQMKNPDQFMKLNHIKIIREFIDTYEALEYPAHFKMFYKKLYEEEDDNEEEIMTSEYMSFFNYKWGKHDKARFRVEHTETKQEVYVEVSIKDTVINLKKAIGKEFNVGPKQFEIMYGPRANKFLQACYDW